MAGTLSVQKIQGLASSATPTTVEISSGHKLTGAAGSIAAPGQVLQVVTSEVTSQFSSSSTGEYDITDMNVSITPTSSSSKVLIFVSMNVGSGQNTANHFNLKRGSTAIAQGSTDGSRTQKSFVFDGGNADANRALTISFHHLDSPNTTSSTTYKITIEKFSSGTTFRLNRVTSAGGGTYDDNFASQITAMEIAG